MKPQTQYPQFVNEKLISATQQIGSFLAPISQLSPNQIHSILGKYQVAIEPNFIQWMQRGYETAKSTHAKNVLFQNVKDEIADNHPQMLRDFTQSAGVEINVQHYHQTSDSVNQMWGLFNHENGLFDVTVAAALENTSLVFIPYLAKIAKQVGGTDFTYTDVHGEADIAHAQELYDGLLDEMNFANAPMKTTSRAFKQTLSLLETILTP